MNIKYIPTSLLRLYKLQWDAMWRAGKAVTYAFTPPYTLAEIIAELKIREEEEKSEE